MDRTTEKDNAVGTLAYDSSMNYPERNRKDQMTSDSIPEFSLQTNQIRQAKSQIRTPQRSPQRQEIRHARAASPVKRIGDGFQTYRNPDYTRSPYPEPGCNPGREYGYERDIHYYLGEDNDIQRSAASRGVPTYNQPPVDEMPENNTYFSRESELYKYPPQVPKTPVKRSGLTRRMERHSIGDNTPEDIDQYHYGGDEKLSHLRAYQEDGGYYYVQTGGDRYDGEGEGYFQSDYYEGDDYYPEANDTEESYYEYDHYDYPPEQPAPRQNPAGNRNANVNKFSMNYDPHQGAYAKNTNGNSTPHKPDQSNDRRRDIYRDIMKKLNETADALKNARVGEPLISSVPNLDYIQRHRNTKLESQRKMENRPPLRRDSGRGYMARDNNDFLAGNNIDKKAISEMDHRKLFGGQNLEGRTNPFSSDSKIPPDVHARYNRNNMNMRGDNEKAHQKAENVKIEKTFNQSAGTSDQAPKTFLQKVQESVARVNQSNMNFDT